MKLCGFDKAVYVRDKSVQQSHVKKFGEILFYICTGEQASTFNDSVDTYIENSLKSVVKDKLLNNNVELKKII